MNLPGKQTGAFGSLALIALICLAFIGVVVFVNQAEKAVNTVVTAEPGKAQPEYVVSNAYHCAKIPPFFERFGLQQPVAIDTVQSVYPGLVVRELRGQQRLFRHPSWSQTGHIGSTVRDATGNIYVIPVPSVGLDTNPLAKRNTIYRVDAATAVMQPFVQLPLPSVDSERNPFGTLGLALDCDTDNLYVSSVANSAPDQALGVIYQIDLKTGKVIGQRDRVDAIGLAVFNHADGKRLYYGDARSSSVFSVPLDNNGGFVGGKKPRHELSLATVKNGDTTQARKLRFTKDRSGKWLLTVTETEFAFRLTAETGRRFKHYLFVLGDDQQQWMFLDIKK